MDDKLRGQLQKEHDALLVESEALRVRAMKIADLLNEEQRAKIADTGISFPDAVRDFLGRRPQVPFTPAEVSAGVARIKGMAETKNFYVSVYIALRRMQAARKIISSMKDGKKAYQLKR